MQEQPRTRDWVKNAAIIFLVVLLVLTFFSNTIMNRSLPEVATQEVTGGSIIARVRGTGTVQANSNTQVKMDRTRVIRSVLVKVGQKVEAGDVLFTLGEGASEEIDAAEEKLQSLQASYNKMAATIPDFSYGADHRRIAMYEEAYREAQQKYDDIVKRMSDESSTSGVNTNQDLQDVADRLKAAQLLKDTLEKVYTDALNERERELDAVQDVETEKFQQYINSQIQEKQSEKQAIEESGDKKKYDDLTQEISELESEVANLELQKEEKQTLVDAKQAEIDSTQNEIDEINRYVSELTSGLEAELQALIDEQNRLSYNLQAIQMNGENADEINEQYKTITAQIDSKRAEIIAKQPEIDSKEQRKSELEQMKSGQEWEKSNYEAEKASLAEQQNVIQTTIAQKEAERPDDPYEKMLNLDSEIARLTEQLATGLTNEELEEIAKRVGEVSREDLDKAIANLEKVELEYENAWATVNVQLTDELRYAKEALRSAELNYVNAKESLRDKIENNDKTLAGYNVDLANLWQQIQRAQEKLDDLLGGEEATVTAKVAGTIQTLDASPGDTKKKDDVIATIEAPDMGYTLSFSVTNDQANRLRVGDTGTVSNFYWGSEITATLNSIKIDQKNPQTNKVLTFDVNGNVTSGTELTVSVGQKSANYDVIVPSSSVRTDANGTFVLKLESKNSPLGNRYYAKRVPVEVLAVDDSNSALNADLGFGDYVITSSSTPLKSGQLVRLATGS